ncbi:MAG: enoyl-CoA hydratase/isomerase family protein [Dehalococcoidia bacterium]
MKNIIVDHKDRVGIIYLNRQEYLNAFDDLMGYELRVQIQKFNSDPHIGSILVSGMGRAFSAGADVGGFEATVNGEQKENRINNFDKWPIFIKNSKPVICALNGFAVGMGITLPLSCDIRLMAKSSKISFRFAAIGLTPEYGSSHLLSQIVGYGKAMEYMLSGRFIDSTEALESGLVNHVFEDNELIDESIKIANQIAQNPEWQLSEIKKMMRGHLLFDDFDKVIETESKIFRQSQDTEAHKEFLLAFRENRKPNFHK